MNGPTDNFMKLVKQKYLSSQSIKLTAFLQILREKSKFLIKNKNFQGQMDSAESRENPL